MDEIEVVREDESDRARAQTPQLVPGNGARARAHHPRHPKTKARILRAIERYRPPLATIIRPVIA